MARTHHVVTIDGQTSFELFESPEEAREMLERLLSRMDGEEQYSLVLGELPPGKRLDDVDTNKFPLEYIQCAGSSDRMTIEIRAGSGDDATQYVVGRSENHSGEPGEQIHWSDHVVEVYEDEAFDTEEATDVFAYYLTHSGAPAKYSLRPRDLGRD